MRIVEKQLHCIYRYNILKIEGKRTKTCDAYIETVILAGLWKDIFVFLLLMLLRNSFVVLFLP